MKIYKTTLIFYLKEDNMTEETNEFDKHMSEMFIQGIERGSNFDDVVNWMLKHNGDEYNLMKAAEEFQELSLAITQYLLRKEDSDPKKRSLQAIIDEIEDCRIRLEVLTQMEHLFPGEKLSERMDYKLAKFQGWIEKKKYTQI